MEKFLENIEEAEKTIQIVDHMIYVTFPLIKDKRLLLKILQEIKKAVTNCINSILQYEYFYKRITLHKNSKTNFKTFVDKCAPRYEISTWEIKLILELFDLSKKHEESPFEFIREEKVIILSENLKPRTLTVEKTKEFLILAKNILKKTRETMKRNF